MSATMTTRRTMTVTVETVDDVLTMRGRRFRTITLPEGSTVRDAAAAVGLDVDGLAKEKAASLSMQKKIQYWFRSLFLGHRDAPAPVSSLIAARNGRDLVLSGDDVESVVLDPGDRLFVAHSPGDPSTIVLAVIVILSSVASYLLLPKIGKVEGGEGGDRRFLFDRFSRDAVAGDVIPVALGRRERHGGRVISVVPFEGPSGESKMRVLVDLGHGELGSIGNQTADFDRLTPGDGAGEIDGVFLNDQPAENFGGVILWGRTGHGAQAPIPGFSDTEITREVGVGGFTLRNTSGSERESAGASAEAELFTTLAAVDALVLRFRFDRGLYVSSSRGRPQTRSVKYRYRIKPASSGSYPDWTVVTVEQAEQSPFFAALRIDGLDPADGLLDIQIERVSVEPTVLNEVDEITWDSVIEVVYSSNVYTYDDGSGGNALLAIEVTASEQLSGDTPRVSVATDGVKVRRWDRASAPGSPVWTTEYSNNPGDVALAFLESVRWGIGAQYGLARVDLDSLFEWIEWCEELVETFTGSGVFRPRFAFNYTLSEPVEGLEGLRMICRAGRCTPSEVGGVWRFVLDREQAIARDVITEASIAEGDEALTVRYDLTVGGLVAPNRLVAEFENADENGEADTLAFPEFSDDALIAGEPLRNGAIQLDGVTNPYQVMAELIHAWKRIRLEKRTVEVLTDREYPSMFPGERFDLATSVVGYGEISGVLRGDSTAAVLRFEGLPELDVMTTYQVVVVMADSSSVAKNVSSFDQSAGYTELTLSSALSEAPPPDAEFALGIENVVMKPFVCESLTLDDADRLIWRVRGREYVESVHDDMPDAALSAPVYGSLRGRSVPPGQVLDLVAVLEIAEGVSRVRLAWRQDPLDASRTGSFSVYRRTAGDMSWRLEPTRVTANNALIGDIDESTTEEFAVVAVSPDGIQLSADAAAQAVFSITTEGGAAVVPLDHPDAVTVADVGDGQTVTIDRVDGASRYHVEIIDAFAAELGNQHFRGYVARTVAQPASGDPSLPLLALPVGVSTQLYVRSVNANGRPSLLGRLESHTAPAPAGESVSASVDFDLSTVGADPDEGYVNLAWNATLSRLEAVDKSLPWSYTSPLQTLSVSEEFHRIRARVHAQQDPEDLTIAQPTFLASTAEADQWRVGDPSLASSELRMFAPPVPVDAVDLRMLIRWRDPVSDELTAWVLLDHLAERIEETTEAQLRVEGSRSRFPYALALLEARLVATS